MCVYVCACSHLQPFTLLLHSRFDSLSVCVCASVLSCTAFIPARVFLSPRSPLFDSTPPVHTCAHSRFDLLAPPQRVQACSCVYPRASTCVCVCLRALCLSPFSLPLLLRGSARRAHPTSTAALMATRDGRTSVRGEDDEESVQAREVGVERGRRGTRRVHRPGRVSHTPCGWPPFLFLCSFLWPVTKRLCHA